MKIQVTVDFTACGDFWIEADNVRDAYDKVYKFSTLDLLDLCGGKESLMLDGGDISIDVNQEENNEND